MKKTIEYEINENGEETLTYDNGKEKIIINGNYASLLWMDIEEIIKGGGYGDWNRNNYADKDSWKR